MSGQAGNPEGCADVLPGSRSALDPGRAIKPGRHGLSPETVAGIQRERLIDAFVQIVSERGYGHTTISRVTEGAGVTKKTFYAHFTDLDDCFLAAYQRGMDILLGRMTQAYESAPSWPEGIHAALRTLLAVLAREPRFARASLVEVNAAGPQVRRARIDNLARFRAFFTDPSLPPVPVAVVDAVVGGVYSAIHVRMETDETEDLPALLAPLTYFALLPFAGRETASAYLDPA
ncbi:TetR/AcrR family transcriptional regulator [Actinomadura madurae]|uniref:TetR/AcrR family transcriptional regulator n=1 Tax=Actinomadura madurae TaxID=1993 RepID=UPI002026752B|nr:TetR/AcrR family transcriptional regulator [Actinomadura madurae]MCQ0018568.1 TetR/AcrR family transcriptional regulator [Actinomadura madurae]URM98585.1 TetR/AcrR family transcriptional regulator [Actinomadura madurae]URN09268.1 TetR/AcrR family transcriptional regulator [Actinomadura madurae]